MKDIQERAGDELWKCLRADKTPWSFGGADFALNRVYRALGLDRPRQVSQEMWRRWQEREKGRS